MAFNHLGCFGIGDDLEIDRLSDDRPLSIFDRDDDRGGIGQIGGFGCPANPTAIVNQDASVWFSRPLGGLIGCSPVIRSHHSEQAGLMVMAKSDKPRADEDSPWKLVLRQYFREAVEFFFPDVAKVVDWTKPVEFLETEFQRITPDAEIGRRFADQLVKVHRKRGKAIFLLIHLEVQAAAETEFAERMFTYAIRIFEYFHEFPVSLAILCDGKSSWRPTRYAVKTAGSAVQFDFTAVKLLD